MYPGHPVASGFDTPLSTVLAFLIFMVFRGRFIFLLVESRRFFATRALALSAAEHKKIPVKVRLLQDSNSILHQTTLFELPRDGPIFNHCSPHEKQATTRICNFASEPKPSQGPTQTSLVIAQRAEQWLAIGAYNTTYPNPTLSVVRCCSCLLYYHINSIMGRVCTADMRFHIFRCNKTCSITTRNSSLLVAWLL